MPDPKDRLLLLLLLTLLLLASPLRFWWSGAGSPWFTPYLVWGGIIALIARWQRRMGGGDSA